MNIGSEGFQDPLPQDPESRRRRAAAGYDIGPRLASEWDLPETQNQFWDRYVRAGYLDPVEGLGQTGKVAQGQPEEEMGAFELMGRGLASGVAGLGKSMIGAGEYMVPDVVTAPVGALQEYLGFEGDISDDMQEWLSGVQHTFRMPEYIQESVAGDPYLPLDPDWYLYNVPSVAASFGLMALPALVAAIQLAPS